mmetsp:Transcript_84231/g.228670  ORF Transcript_84231/g.228670 Transcript_84231/m.228670 type:complete len:271 (-) Transcript_84231:47-859(-)
MPGAQRKVPEERAGLTQAVVSDEVGVHDLDMQLMLPIGEFKLKLVLLRPLWIQVVIDGRCPLLGIPDADDNVGIRDIAEDARVEILQAPGGQDAHVQRALDAADGGPIHHTAASHRRQGRLRAAAGRQRLSQPLVQLVGGRQGLRPAAKAHGAPRGAAAAGGGRLREEAAEARRCRTPRDSATAAGGGSRSSRRLAAVGCRDDSIGVGRLASEPRHGIARCRQRRSQAHGCHESCNFRGGGIYNRAPETKPTVRHHCRHRLECRSHAGGR